MAYNEFAYYYDSLMEESFYENYLKFILNQGDFNSVLELGCGTGIIAVELAKLNKEIYATDLSEDMLVVAKERAIDQDVNIMLGRLDMTDFRVNQQLDEILCLCDSLNYIHSKNQVLKVFENVYKALKPGGRFIFDVHSMHKVNNVFTNYHEHYEEDDFYFDWQVKKTGEGKIQHHVIIHDYENKCDVDEIHVQQTYSVDEYVKQLNRCRFSDIQIYSDFKEYDEKDDRVIFVVTK